MSTDWTVEEYATGTETAPTASHTFHDFEGAYGHLRARKAVVEIIRIMGPREATDGQLRLIVEAGGVPTFET